MKMRVESKDIYDIQIDEIDTGNFNGCPEGYSDFDVEVDDVTQDGDITIEISGDCECFGYHDSMPCTFTGTLTMDESEFISEYTYAAEDGDKYITFDGSIEISLTSGTEIELDADDIVEDTFEDTTTNILHKIEEELSDGTDMLREVVQYILASAADKVIKEIKRIDNIDIDKDNKDDYRDEYIDYVLKNIIDDWTYAVKDNKYKSIETILNAQMTEDINKGEIATLINDELAEEAECSTETFEITAKVFFSDLDP